MTYKGKKMNKTERFLAETHGLPITLLGKNEQELKRHIMENDWYIEYCDFLSTLHAYCDNCRVHIDLSDCDTYITTESNKHFCEVCTCHANNN